MKNKKIEINKRLLKKLGFDDYREFVDSFGGWCYCKDWTYQERIYTKSFDRLLKEFIKWRLEE